MVGPWTTPPVVTVTSFRGAMPTWSATSNYTGDAEGDYAQEVKSCELEHALGLSCVIGTVDSRHLHGVADAERQGLKCCYP